MRHAAQRHVESAGQPASAGSRAAAGLLALLSCALGASAQTSEAAQSSEADYYSVDYFVPPEGEVLEVGGMVFLPDGRLAVSTRRGQVWLIENVMAADPAEAVYTLFAEGLDEGLGLALLPSTEPGGEPVLHVLQRGELSRLHDEDGDSRCERIETVSTDWGLSGNYHEFAFGLPVSAQGQLYLSLNVSFFSPEWWHGKSPVPYRGWVLQADPRTGLITPLASGLRSPAGLGLDSQGRLLVTDNQGDWMPAGPVFHIQPGKFYGHPASLAWNSADRNQGPEPSDTEPPQRTRAPAALWLPYKWSRSAGNLVPDQTGGRFGPFNDQMFIAELTNGMVLRAQLEEVRGVLQGAVWPFRQHVGSAFRAQFAPDGSLLLGFTNRGWGGLAPNDGLARLRWTQRVPLEVARVHLLQSGFELSFTQPLAQSAVIAPNEIEIVQYDYDWWWEYGSPERRHRPVEVLSVTLAPDRRTLTLHTAALTPAMVARVKLPRLSAEDGSVLLHDEFAYTINQLPEGPLTTEHVAKAVAPPPERDSYWEGWLRLTYGDALELWQSHGWALVTADLAPEGADQLQVTEGVDALVNVATLAQTQGLESLKSAGAAAQQAAADPLGSGPYTSRLNFGDAQIHVEFLLTEGARAALFVQGRYGIELSAEACGALLPQRGERLGQPPALDAYQGPGRWHSLDLSFVAPRFDAQGRKTSPARFRRVTIDDILLHEEVALAAPSAGELPLAEGSSDEIALGPLVISGGSRPMALRSIRVKPLAPPTDESGFVPIFDGESLTGWVEQSDDLSKPGWEIVDGILTGTGPRSHLFSPRGDYQDLEVRAELRISDNGNSGLYVRTALGNGWPAGYEAQINSNYQDPQKTGSLYALAPVRVQLVPPGVWFDYRVHCRESPAGAHRDPLSGAPSPAGTRLTISVNGVVITDFIDTERRHAQGHVALQQHHEGSVVEFRRIEVRESR
ncbi:MAG: family 16 glycoside hydrolase [Planctomycetota bacterium]